MLWLRILCQPCSRVLYGTKVRRYNKHTAGSMGWPFTMLKYKYIFQIKYTEATLSNSTRKLLWFEISKMLIAVKKNNKFTVSFIIIFGTLSFPISALMGVATFSYVCSVVWFQCLTFKYSRVRHSTDFHYNCNTLAASPLARSLCNARASALSARAFPRWIHLQLSRRRCLRYTSLPPLLLLLWRHCCHGYYVIATTAAASRRDRGTDVQTPLAR